MTTAAPTLERNFSIVENPDGTSVVCGVPIFAVCDKDGFGLDEKWLDEALAHHRGAEGVGKHVVPMHIGHHGDDQGVQPAGTAIGIRKAMVRSKGGSLKVGAVADLVFTDSAALTRAKAMQLLWRSPEIPIDKTTRKPEARFRSVALLDRANPHNELPVLTFGERPVPTAWRTGMEGPVLALAGTGEAFYAFLDPETVVHLDEGSHEGPGAVIERVKSLTAEELAEFRRSFNAFLAECEVGGGGVSGGPANLMHETGETAMPNETKTASTSDEVIALRADIEALKLRESQRDQGDALKSAVDDAMAKIGPKRGVTREEVLKFAETFDGPARVKAVTSYAESIVAKVPEGTSEFVSLMASKAAAMPTVPEEVLKLQAEGTAAYEHGLAQHKVWLRQDQGTRTRIPLARWLEIHPPATALFTRDASVLED